jgi:rRNA maturation endonuclease Nob1
MVLTAIGLFLVLATALALAWPLLSPPHEEPEAPVASDPAARLRSEKDTALAAIREADFDHETGKLSEEDYRVLRAELEERALGALAALDQVAGTATPPVGAAVERIGARATAAAFCPGCGRKRSAETDFCSHCGHKFARGRAGERRRRA